MIRDRVRKIGTTATQTDARTLAATCDALRTHAVESVVRGGYAVPMAALRAIRREIWDAGWDARVACRRCREADQRRRERNQLSTRAIIAPVSTSSLGTCTGAAAELVPGGTKGNTGAGA